MRVPGEGPSPPRSTEVDWCVVSPAPVAGKLGVEVQQGDAVRPRVAAGVNVQLQNGAVEEDGGGFGGTLLHLNNADFPDCA